ncbi:hypothetical protein SAMN04487928_10479 [Butyrivibrio proteoclasticus]|uniref:Uncharacterized protein n=1 Tax=Butyrivibrio proteoclasticus TaxID=43305 RepID=A0A1I5RLD6_9FIRM|nr:hypothetical protein [Butyrivibrio proteoclasticus]SFP59220.1 hypothetical protein SAMN04487928_10479 [Butyrivibrio proteoclasticus]
MKKVLVDNMNSVDDWFKWSESKGQSVEKARSNKVGTLQWEYPDVLYSFLGIYTLGIWSFYKDDQKQGISLSGIIIKNNEGHNLYNRKYLSKTHRKYHALNETEELKTFIEHYSTIGNVCPTWPGGNEHRGKSHCYDIPDVYYKRHERWYRELVTQNPTAFLKDVVDSGFAVVETSDLLERVDTPKKYISFLKHVNHVIDKRNELLMKIVKEER